MTAQLVEHYAPLVDGRSLHLRSVQAADRHALLTLNEAVSQRSIYLRFFSTNRTAADNYVEHLVRPASADHHALIAELGDRAVGVAGFERIGTDAAEIALLVADDCQHDGVGTLLLEHLAAVARSVGIRSFVADVLIENAAMIGALHDLGFPTRSQIAEGVDQISFELVPTESLFDAMDARDAVADSASMHPLLQPSSIAVIGAGSKERSVGRQILHNLLDGCFRGRVFVVNPNHRQVLGVPSVPSARDLPVAVDLAVIAVPAGQVLAAVTDCGRRGVRAVLVVSSGFSEVGRDGAAEQDRLLSTVRKYGMRMVGPNCLGLINTDPSVQLNATFAPLPVHEGGLALVSQSGALGIAILRAAQRSGQGIAQFASIGNKADVSGNDLLLSWELDNRIQVIALYLESFGNPRKFARIARRVSRTKPILAIKAGRSQAGQRAGASHTAAAAASDVIVDALFEQAGVLRMDTMEEMLDVARVLCGQPLPAGPRVVVVGNSGGPGILAADAASAAGLDVVQLSAQLRGRISQAAPALASSENPIDLGAAAQPFELQAVLSILERSDEVDMVLGIVTETLVADRTALSESFTRAAADAGKPIVAVQTGDEDRSLVVDDRRILPVFAFPEPAARALGTAARYARLRSAPARELSRPSDVQLVDARRLLTDRIGLERRWLDTRDTVELLDQYGIQVCVHRLATDLRQAERAASEIGFPLAMKVADGTVHKSDIGGVRLGVHSMSELRQAFSELAALADGRVLLQPMVSGDVEIVVGGMQEHQFGPVVMVGAGGTLTDLLSDRRFLLAPTNEAEALDALSQLRMSRLLDGYRGRPPVSRQAVAELICRVSLMVHDLPEIAEMDLNPVIGRGEELIVVDAKIALEAAAARPDLAVRQLAEPAAARAGARTDAAPAGGSALAEL